MERHHRPVRRLMRPRQVAVAGVVGLLLTVLLDAGPLERGAETSAFGPQRTVTLALLRPALAISQALRLDRPRAAVDTALGRNGADGPAVGPVQEALPMPPPTRVIAVVSDATRSRRLVLGTPQPRHAWTAQQPLRMWVGGDSIAGYLSYAMVDIANASSVIACHPHFKISTGLARPDYYDWPAHLEEDMHAYDPEVVVILMGGNDDQPLADGGGYDGFGSAAWRAEYGRRAGAVMDRLTAEGRLVFWVGLPPMRDAGFSQRMSVVNSVLAEQAAMRPGVTFIDSRPVLADASGGYAPYLPDASGQLTLMRAPDGVHLSPSGGRRLAEAVLAQVRTVWAQVDRGTRSTAPIRVE